MSSESRYVPHRKCIACGAVTAQENMIRFTYDGNLHVDTDRRNPGRGSYLCNNRECISKALKKNAFARAYRTQIKRSELEEIERYLNAK